jgi:hypothetical protein
MGQRIPDLSPVDIPDLSPVDIPDLSPVEIRKALFNPNSPTPYTL